MPSFSIILNNECSEADFDGFHELLKSDNNVEIKRVWKDFRMFGVASAEEHLRQLLHDLPYIETFKPARPARGLRG